MLKNTIFKGNFGLHFYFSNQLQQRATPASITIRHAVLTCVNALILRERREYEDCCYYIER